MRWLERVRALRSADPGAFTRVVVAAAVVGFVAGLLMR